MTDRRHLFIAGAMRSGTTWLATVLDEHPEIYFAKPLVEPELKFFLDENEYARGPDYYLQKYFPRAESARILGEKTVHYFEREDAVARIRNWFPGALVLVILRNPAERAVSNYFFSVNRGLETRSPEEVFLLGIKEPSIEREMYISPFAYLERGEYARHLAVLEKYFPRDRVMVLIYEEVAGDLSRVQDLYHRLGVTPHFTPGSRNKRIFATPPNRPEISSGIMDFLDRYYRDHNRELEDFLGRDLSLWSWKGAVQ